jgi:hypothetical protein
MGRAVSNNVGSGLTRNVTRRLERLETRAAASARAPLCFRVHLVHPEKGLTGILVIESDKPTIEVPPTSEEVERVRADLERRRAARLLWKGGAAETHDCATA